MSSRRLALLIDITRCVGCRACAEACKQLHGFPGDPWEETELSATAYTVVRDSGDHFVRRLCMHCVQPACASACPVGALRKTKLGPVVYDAALCLGCRYCMVACPFGVPRYEWSSPTPVVAKCDLCHDRLQRGELPACAEACPAEAVVVGEREDLLVEARQRIAREPDRYHPHVYGEAELGGTGVLMLAPVPFAELGLPAELGTAPLPELTWKALRKVPGVVGVGGAMLAAVWWITQRREEVARYERELAEAATTASGPPDERVRRSPRDVESEVDHDQH